MSPGPSLSSSPRHDRVCQSADRFTLLQRKFRDAQQSQTRTKQHAVMPNLSGTYKTKA